LPGENDRRRRGKFPRRSVGSGGGGGGGNAQCSSMTVRGCQSG